MREGEWENERKRCEAFEMRYSVAIFLFSKDYSSALRKYVILMAQLHHSPQNIFVTKSHTCVALTLISVRMCRRHSLPAHLPKKTRAHTYCGRDNDETSSDSWDYWQQRQPKTQKKKKRWRKIKQFSCAFNAFVIADELYSPNTTRWPHAVRANCDINHILCETTQTTTLAHAHTAHDTSAHIAHILRANYLIPLNCLLILHVYTLHITTGINWVHMTTLSWHNNFVLDLFCAMKS